MNELPMISIKPAVVRDAEEVARVGRQSCIESHGRSASKRVIDAYIGVKFTAAAMEEELSDPQNIFYLVYHGQELAGYSKILLDAPHPNISLPSVTKLERLYLLEAYHGYKLGAELMQFNMDLSRKKGQRGMWLFVWTENGRAIRFYTKMGFRPIGNYDFQLTDDHANPNYQMLLTYDG